MNHKGLHQDIKAVMVNEVTSYMNIVWQRIHFEFSQMKSPMFPKIDEMILSIINLQIDPE